MKHLNLEIKHNIAFLTWDQKDSSVNLIDGEFIKELNLITKKLNPHEVKALVFASNKKKSFSAGADIKEIQKDSLSLKLDTVNQLFLKFEHLNFLKIVLIEGDCLGGGLEWALCFDKILVSDKARLQLPEVHLGLVPGFGGCFRLPKRIGLLESLKMVCSAKSLDSKKAYQLGLADEKVPQLLLRKRAIELAFELIPDLSQTFSFTAALESFVPTYSSFDKATKSSKKNPPYTLNHNVLKKSGFKIINKISSKIQKECPFFTKNKYRFNKPYAYWRDFFFCSLISFVFKSKIKEKTKGFYPAPLKAVSLVSKGYRSSISFKLLEGQKKVFKDLALGTHSKNLISLFLQSKKSKKCLSLSLAKKDDKPIQKVGVLGAGVMGSSIACLLANKGFEVRLIDKQTLALQEALKKWEAFLKKQKQKKLINSYTENYKKNLLSVSQNFWGISKKDLVIECLPEDLSLKKESIAFVSKKMKADGLLASNSSSLSIKELAKSSIRPERFFGLHFFNPAHQMPLIEICYHENQKAFLSALPPFIEKLGKTPLVVKDSPGFVVNRILVTYFLEAFSLLEKGYSVEELDTLLKEKGFPLGPFELMDKIGLDTCLQVLDYLKQEEKLKIPEGIEDLTKVLGLGEKEEKGFYLYESHSSYFDKKQVNPKTEVLKRGDLKIEDKSEELFQQLLKPMFETGKNLLEKGIVREPYEIDMAMVLGAGFPAFRKGLMQKEKD